MPRQRRRSVDTAGWLFMPSHEISAFCVDMRTSGTLRPAGARSIPPGGIMNGVWSCSLWRLHAYDESATNHDNAPIKSEFYV